MNGGEDMDFVEKNVCTHTTNRGATHTCKTSFNLSCDWVTANSQNNSDFESFLSLLGLDLDLFECVSTNLYKCKTMYFYNGIRVFTDSILRC